MTFTFARIARNPLLNELRVKINDYLITIILYEEKLVFLSEILK